MSQNHPESLRATMRMSLGRSPSQQRHAAVVREDGDVGEARLVGAQIELAREQSLPPRGVDHRAHVHAPARPPSP